MGRGGARPGAGRKPRHLTDFDGKRCRCRSCLCAKQIPADVPRAKQQPDARYAQLVRLLNACVGAAGGKSPTTSYTPGRGGKRAGSGRATDDVVLALAERVRLVVAAYSANVADWRPPFLRRNQIAWAKSVSERFGGPPPDDTIIDALALLQAFRIRERSPKISRHLTSALALARERGVSLKRLAKGCGVNPTTLSQLLRGGRPIYHQDPRIVRVAAALGVTSDKCFSTDEP